VVVGATTFSVTVEKTTTTEEGVKIRTKEAHQMPLLSTPVNLSVRDSSGQMVTIPHDVFVSKTFSVAGAC
jgi:hypothetical protein